MLCASLLIWWIVKFQTIRHIRSIRETCPRYQVWLYKAWPRIRFHSIIYFSLPPVGDDSDDSLAISFHLLPTCKVHEGNSSHHRIGPLPIEFVPPLLRRDNSILFNPVFSFLSFVYIASWFLWSRYSYDAPEHRSVKCPWVIGRFKRDRYSRVASYFQKKSQWFPAMQFDSSVTSNDTVL
jgi:hypothetical protein